MDRITKLTFFIRGECDQWSYEFEKREFELSNDQVIKIGNKLTAKLKFDQPSYQGGQKLYVRDGLQITDTIAG